MTVETVDTMVRRGETYSRTGVNGLDSSTDDEHFQHAASLGLVKHFNQHDLPQVEYYCALREATPGKKDIEFIGGPGDFVFAGLKFHFPKEDFFGNKYANRGPSAILDYLIPKAIADLPADA